MHRHARTAAAICIAATIMMVSSCAAMPWHRTERTRPDQATVVRVIDGDTVVLQLSTGDEHIRLIGIDTPETVKPDTPVQCYGPEASTHLKHLLPPGTRVRVARDAEARDHFGRLLLYVWRTVDNLFVNLDIAANGFGRPLAIAPNNAHRADFAAAASQAQAGGIGLWGSCPGR